MAIALDITMYLDSSRGVQENTSIRSRSWSLDLKLVFPCTPLLSSRYRLSTELCKVATPPQPKANRNTNHRVELENLAHLSAHILHLFVIHKTF